VETDAAGEFIGGGDGRSRSPATVDAHLSESCCTLFLNVRFFILTLAQGSHTKNILRKGDGEGVVGEGGEGITEVVFSELSPPSYPPC
jgi:hypothetical protein